MLYFWVERSKSCREKRVYLFRGIGLCIVGDRDGSVEVVGEDSLYRFIDANFRCSFRLSDFRNSCVTLKNSPTRQ